MMMPPLLARHRRQAGLVLALVASSAVCTALVGARVVFTGHFSYVFLVKNLILAWMPVVFALVASASGSSLSARGAALTLASAAAWLLFFPNAPYMITDLMHLKHHSNPLFWLDVVTLPSFAWTGLVLGFVSLFWMQDLAVRRLGRVAGWLLAVLALGLGAFGVSLGRFHRWNSWDVLAQPGDLFEDVLSVFSHPLVNARTFAFSALLALSLASAYLVLYALAHLRPETPPAA
jgi:uncharacterized membrane protein